VNGEHHVTIPDHSQLRIGTLRSVLAAIGGHFGLTREELANDLFGINR
jgi:hypothetical protein